MSQATELAPGHLNGADELVILLNQPDNQPAVVIVKWPSAPSVATLQAFPTVANKAASLFAQAVVRLSQLRRERRL